MNHIETFIVDYPAQIESTLNDFCEKNMCNPLSVSVTEYGHNKRLLLTLVVEHITEGEF